jgi:hypothetical protein
MTTFFETSARRISVRASAQLFQPNSERLVAEIKL